MFHLIKILNARTGAPEPMRIPLASAATVQYGMPVSIKKGVLTAMNSASTSLPTHLILKDGKNTSEVLATPITPEMIFEVPASAAPTAMEVGGEYLLSGDGMSVSATAVSSGTRGATLISKSGAHLVGDNLLVAFKN